MKKVLTALFLLTMAAVFVLACVGCNEMTATTTALSTEPITELTAAPPTEPTESWIIEDLYCEGKIDDNEGLYSDGWAVENKDAELFYGGSVHFCNTPGSTAEFYIRGSSIQIFGSRERTHGKFAVYIDEVFIENVDTYGKTREVQQLLFESSNLANGNHILKIVVLQERNESAIAGYVDLDYLVAAAASEK